MRRPSGRRWRRRLPTLIVVGVFAVMGVIAYQRCGDASRPLTGSGTRTVSAHAASWPMGNGDLAATRSTAATPALDGEIAWEVQLDSAAVTPPVANDRALYLGLREGALIALSALDGREIWRVLVPGWLDAAPSLAGDRLYAVLRGGSVVSLDAGTGRTVWSVTTRDFYAASLLVADGIVYAVSSTHVRAFDAESGAPLWAYGLAESWQVVPPVVAARWLVLSTRTEVLVLDRTTGERTYFFSTRGLRSLSMAGEDVIAVWGNAAVSFGADERRPWWDRFRRAWVQFYVWAIAPAPPTQPRNWVTAAPRDSLPPAVTDEVVVLAAAGGTVSGLDVATGAERWRYVGAPLAVPPVATAEGILLVEAGALVVIDESAGTVRGHRVIDWQALSGVAVTERATYLIGDRGGVLSLRRAVAPLGR